MDARPLQVSKKVKAIIKQSNAREKRRRRLLAEFLQKKFRGRLTINSQAGTSSQDAETEVRNIPDDLLFKIFILLPDESLVRLQFVCKKWFGLINSSVFIRFHAQQSQTVLVSRKLTLLEPLLALQYFGDKQVKPYLHFLDLDNGNLDFVESSVANLVDIQASYNGLVLATLEKNNSLIFMNPLTRKHIALPLGTIISNSCEESYGITFCVEVKTYEVVHLFVDEREEVGCEILSICARKWTRIEGPPREFLWYVGLTLVSTGGSVHFLVRKYCCNYSVSLNVRDEKFVIKKLPVIRGLNNGLVEIQGSLGFVALAEDNLLQVWILLINDDGLRGNWEKRYTIDTSGDVRNLVPISSSRNGKEVVFQSPFHHLYVYNFDKDEMRMLHVRDDDDDDDDDEVWFELEDRLYFTHSNTLAPWEGLL